MAGYLCARRISWSSTAPPPGPLKFSNIFGCMEAVCHGQKTGGGLPHIHIYPGVDAGAGAGAGAGHILAIHGRVLAVIYDVRFPSLAGSWQFLVSLLEFCGCFLLS